MKANYGKMLTAVLTVVFLTCLVMASGVGAEAPVGVKVMEKKGLGKYLTDGKGMTLYTFDKDTAGKSTCSGACLTNWPVFSSKAGLSVEGCDVNDFGTITRGDGAEQVTYKAKPLYYFVKDQKPGETNGQGVNNVWWIVKQ